MTAPAAELQRAVFEALSADGDLAAKLGPGRIFDRAPANTPFPYITFGRTSLYDWSTGTESGTEQLFTLHVWSKAKGKKEGIEVMEAARRVLHEAALPLVGHHLVNIRLEFSEIRFDEDLSVHHGLLRFRAVSEELA